MIFVGACLVFAWMSTGCDKQTKINAQKIDTLAQRITQLEKAQVKQMELMQAELNSLAPELTKINSTYFEKNQADALFFHTNTLFLLVTISKQIQGQLQLAAEERESQNAMDYTYHTNQLGALYASSAQIQESLIDQEKLIIESINAEIHHSLNDAQSSLSDQIKTATAPDPAWKEQRTQMQAELTQIQRDLDAIKARLVITNQPAPGGNH